MGITTQQVLEWVGKNFWQLMIFLSLFIQLTPIKINPWSTIFKAIGKAFTQPMSEQIKGLITKIDEIDSEVKENEKDRIRWEILDFANSCHHGRKHSRDEFKHIIELNDKYKVLLTKTKDQNGVFDAEYTYIKNLYNELNSKEDAFLN